MKTSTPNAGAVRFDPQDGDPRADTLFKLIGPLRALVKRRGPRWMRQLVWDADARRGTNLHQVDTAYRSTICDLIEKYSSGGDILDLGCSDGHVCLGLSQSAFASYMGIDISEVAIEEASRKRDSMGTERASKVTFQVGDIGTHSPAKRLKVILFKDSLYYLTRRDMVAALEHYERFLQPDGVFVVQMDNINRHDWIRDLIRKKFKMIEDIESRDEDLMRLVFRRDAA
jgi:SAM-dependent methyltransferase